MPPNDDRLEPCPECGEAVRATLARPPGERGRLWAGRCLACGFQGPIRWSMSQAERAWNALDRSTTTANQGDAAR